MEMVLDLEYSILSKVNAIRDGLPAVTLTMWPKTFVPRRSTTPFSSGTSCAIRAEIGWPGTALSSEMVELSRTGKIVPSGMLVVYGFS
jgi:hypothetical protein